MTSYQASRFMQAIRIIRRTGATAIVVVAAALVVTVAAGDGVRAFADTTDRTADIVAIETTQACYGRAQDVVYRNYANESKAKSEGRAAFSVCFTPDTHISIGLFGQVPFEKANSINEWVDFVWQFGQEHGYLSTRHLIGNVEVVLTGTDSATVFSSGTTPHFIGAGPMAQSPGVDWITGNYRGQVRRIHGQWLITDFQINADEFAHAAVDYPLGRSDGSGNIGFPDNIPSITNATRP